MMAVKRWTDAEDQFLRFNYVRYTNEILANQMERSSGAIKDRAARLGIQKSGSRKGGPKLNIITWLKIGTFYHRR